MARPTTACQGTAGCRTRARRVPLATAFAPVPRGRNKDGIAPCRRTACALRASAENMRCFCFGVTRGFSCGRSGSLFQSAHEIPGKTCRAHGDAFATMRGIVLAKSAGTQFPAVGAAEALLKCRCVLPAEADCFLVGFAQARAQKAQKEERAFQQAALRAVRPAPFRPTAA